jgi:hypothetical protein
LSGIVFTFIYFRLLESRVIYDSVHGSYTVAVSSCNLVFHKQEVCQGIHRPQERIAEQGESQVYQGVEVCQMIELICTFDLDGRDVIIDKQNLFSFRDHRPECLALLDQAFVREDEASGDRRML